MKKILTTAAAASLILAGTSCLAADDVSMYVKGAVKYVMPSDPSIEALEVESDNGYGFGGAIGIKYDFLRLEAEIATQKTDVEAVHLEGRSERGVGSGDTRITTYMVNGYIDLPINDNFGFYVTGGLGAGTTTLSIYDIDGDDSGFAWKAGAGIFYTYDRHLYVDIGYEYVSLDDADFDVSVDDINTQNISAAIRYQF